ncbi:MAG: alpha-glucosidase C-terminal domain-containing protein, partial [Thermoguttaceae bacterium]|nr:alpha-glucosidase C-terminal domain-containing protein [Thermoguttaceae bacterium]
LEWLDNSAGERVLSFLRAADEETLLVLINLKEAEAHGETSAPGTWESVFGDGSAAADEGKIAFTLAPYGFAVFRRQ